MARLCGWKLSAEVRKGPSPTGWSSRGRTTLALDGGLNRGARCPGVLFCDVEHRCHPRLEALVLTVRLPVPSRTSSLFPPDRERLRLTLNVFPATSTNLF